MTAAPSLAPRTAVGLWDSEGQVLHALLVRQPAGKLVVPEGRCMHYAHGSAQDHNAGQQVDTKAGKLRRTSGLPHLVQDVGS